MASNKPAVQIRGVRKSFGEGTARIEALRGIDLDAFYGEILLMVGPSGCGKTTLLCVITGLLDHDAGQVTLFGESLDAMSHGKQTAFRRENIGFVFQQFNLLPTLTAAENAAVPLMIQGLSRKHALQRSEELLVQVGLKDRLKNLPAKLSGGEQQRVAIARSLASRPRLLVCDEPTAALDGDTGAQVMDTVRKTALSHDRCLIIVTHDSRIFSFGDRMARMLDGHVISVGPVPRNGAPAAAG
ncbi:MAG TPA: ABC transporter ATP-binding protein [Planctomycetota bacterium]|jgi:putative ABC transport system ATP-binding protein